MMWVGRTHPAPQRSSASLTTPHSPRFLSREIYILNFKMQPSLRIGRGKHPKNSKLQEREHSELNQGALGAPSWWPALSNACGAEVHMGLSAEHLSFSC